MLLLLLLLGLGVASSTTTGHRAVHTMEDFDRFVLKENLPTLLLIHSSKMEDCKYGHDCAKLYENFKRAALETKGYVRFSSIDAAEPEGKALVLHRLQIKEEPPVMMAFRDAPDLKTGRPAFMLQHLDALTATGIKNTASALLPRDAHRSDTVQAFEKARVDALKRFKLPLVAVLAPKISLSAMVKSMHALVRTVANFTLVETGTEEGKKILALLQLNDDVNTTRVVAISKHNNNQVVMMEEEKITPQAVYEFAARQTEVKPKQQQAPVFAVPHGVFANLSALEFAKMVNHSLPVISWFSKQTQDVEEASAMLRALPDRENIFDKYGISTIIVLGEEERFQVDSTWLNKPAKFPTFQEAATFAQTHMQKRNLDYIDPIDSASISDFFVQSAGQWKDMTTWPTGRMVLIYISSSNMPQALQAAAYATRAFTHFVHLTSPVDDDILRRIHINPETVTEPYLVCYVPNLEMERKSLLEEAEERQAFEKEQAKNRKRKGSQEQMPSKNRGVNFHIIPFNSNQQTKEMTFGAVVDFVIAMLQQMDSTRWESTILYELPQSGMPHAVYGDLVKQVHKKKLAEGTMLPDVEAVTSEYEFDLACAGDKLCAVAFSSSGNVDQAVAVLQQAKVELEKSTVSSFGVRLVVVDGSCHYRFVEALGGDAAMLPSFVLWNRKLNGVAWLRGTFNSNTVADLVQAVKRSRVGLQKVASSDNVLLFEEECPTAGADVGNEEEEDDELLKEMRLEAQREEEEREQRRLDAIAEAKRLKAQAEQDKKATRDMMNKKASEERNKKTEL